MEVRLTCADDSAMKPKSAWKAPNALRRPFPPSPRYQTQELSQELCLIHLCERYYSSIVRQNQLIPKEFRERDRKSELAPNVLAMDWRSRLLSYATV